MISKLAVAGTAVAGLIFALFVWRRTQRSKNARRAPVGIVLLHQFPPWPTIVSSSPPCLKLETYLRMANIPYETEYGTVGGSKGKMPWIEFNGQEIPDSNFCIGFLNKEFSVDIDGYLSEEQKAVARCVLTMLEENTYWTMVYHRWLNKDSAPVSCEKLFGVLPLPLKYFVFRSFQQQIRTYLYGHGMGRHSEQEISGIAKQDLTAISIILGNKEFLFGSRPCVADAALFALVANLVLDMPSSPPGKLIKNELRNLEEHMDRMKTMYFPDWCQLVTS